MRKIIEFLQFFMQNFNKKHRLSYNSSRSERVVWQIFVSPLNGIVCFLTLLTLLFIIAAALLIFTPISEFLPGMHSATSRTLLLSNISRLDSLEKEMVLWSKYRDNVLLAMDGGEVQPITREAKIDSLSQHHNETPISEAELALRQEVAQKIASERSISAFKMFTPVDGVVVRGFSYSKRDLGIGIESQGMAPVLAADDGTVVLSSWSVDDGYILQIQHANNLITSYKKMSKLLKQSGARVKGGEVIGYIGVEDEANTNPQLQFEIWSNGNSIDPESYLIF